MGVSKNTQKNKQWFIEQFSNSSDLVLKCLTIEDNSYLIVYLETMADTDAINEHVIRPMQDNPGKPHTSVISILDNKPAEELSDVLNALIEGKSAIQRDGDSFFSMLGTEMHSSRAVNLPVNERVLRGPKQAFVENFDTNIYMIREYASSSKMVINYYTLGGHSETRVAVTYMKGICKPGIVEELTKRFKGAEGKDATVTLGSIKETVVGRSLYLAPPVLITERPDRAKAYLMEGKAVVVVEGNADVVVTPISFWSFFQSPDDYNINWVMGSVIRLMRLFALVMTLVLPGFYVSFTSFVPFMLPTEIALTLQSSLRYISIMPVLEVLFMLLVLEIVREAALRLANSIAQTIGVVGGIVLGSAIVQSNLVSNTAVIVVSLTGLASFIIPVYEMSMAVRLYSVIVTFAAQLLGIVGMTLSLMVFVIHLSRMRTLGEPYFEAAFPFFNRMKDTYIRVPDQPVDTSDHSRG